MTSTLIDAGLTSLGQLGTYTAGQETASTERILGTEGGSVTRNRQSRRAATREYGQTHKHVPRLYRGMDEGDRRDTLYFQEAMARADFGYLFGDILDRQLLSAYQTQAVQWPAYAKRGRVRDFRSVRRYTLDGGEATLNPVKELAPYNNRALTDGVS